jgi:NAD(P)-dependent dehydrogenase (short-subunit alcohol dehydrogenase family)
VIADLTGRNAVITGAANGIGLAIATRCAERGMRVLLGDIEAEGAERAAELLRESGGDAHAVGVDVADPDDVEALATSAAELLGPVHLLVNNAGVVGSGRSSWELPLEEWHRVVDINLWGVVHGLRSFVPGMLAGGEEGHIVITGSMASVQPRAFISPYVATKHALLGLADSLRAELEAEGAPIGVTLVMPGRIRTAMNPEGAPASDVAAVVELAIRDDLPYVFNDADRLPDVAARFEAILRTGDPRR